MALSWIRFGARVALAAFFTTAISCLEFLKRPEPPPPPDNSLVTECGVPGMAAGSANLPPTSANLNSVAVCLYRSQAPVHIYKDTAPGAQGKYYYSYLFQPLLPAQIDTGHDPTGMSIRLDLKMTMLPAELKEACRKQVDDSELDKVARAEALPLLWSRVALQVPRASRPCDLRDPGVIHSFGPRERIWIRAPHPQEALRIRDAINHGGGTVSATFGLSGVRTEQTCNVGFRVAQSVNYEAAIQHLRQRAGRLHQVTRGAPELYANAAIPLTDEGMRRLKANVGLQMGLTISRKDGVACDERIVEGLMADLVSRDGG